MELKRLSNRVLFSNKSGDNFSRRHNTLKGKKGLKILSVKVRATLQGDAIF